MSGSELGRFFYSIGVDQSQFEKGMANARKALDDFSKTAQTSTAPANAALDKTSKSVEELRKDVLTLTADNQRLRQTLQFLGTEFTKLSQEAEKSGRQMERGLQPLNPIVQNLKNQIRQLVFAYLGFATVRGVATRIQEFQDLERQLSRVTGTAGSADRVLGNLRRLFAGQAVDVRDASRAYIELVQSGIEPTYNQMQAVANIASTVGGSVESVAKAVGDATRREFDGLRELGFGIQEVGNRVRITFQGVTRTVGNDARSIRDAIESIGAVQLSGAASQATDLSQAYARLKNVTDELVVAFGESGLSDALAKVINKIADLIPYVTPLANAIGTVLTWALNTASAAIDLFIAGLDAIITGIRTIMTLAQTGSFTAAGETMTQGLQRLYQDFDARQGRSGSAQPPTNILPGQQNLRVNPQGSARTRVRPGGGGGPDPRIQELTQAVEKLNEEAAGLETTSYEAGQRRLQRTIDEMRAAGGALAAEADRLEPLLNQARLRRNDALQDRAVRDIQDENGALRIRLNLGEREAEVYTEVLRLRQQGVTVTSQTIDALRAEINARAELEEALKEQTRLNEELASGLSDAFGSAFQSAMQPGAKLSDILKQLERDLLNLGTRILVLEPLQKMLREIVSGPSGGGGGGGLLGQLTGLLGFGGQRGGGSEIVGDIAAGALKSVTGAALGAGSVTGLPTGFIFHEGGIAGQGGRPTFDAPKAWSTAPRFYTGLAANEMRAVIERGEAILNGRQQAAVAAASGGKTEIHFHGVTDADSFKRSQGQILGRMAATLGRAGRVR